jgi:hypothetical protein
MKQSKSKPRIWTDTLSVNRVLVVIPADRRLLGPPRRRWEDNIEMDIQEGICGALTGSSWLRIGTVEGTYDCGNEPWGSTKCGEFLY